MSGADRLTDAERALRIGEVHNLLVNGVRRADILRHASNKEWGVSSRTVDDYIARATAEIKAAATVDKEERLGRSLRRLENLYQATQRIQDHKTSLSVVKTEADLLGLAAPAKHELSGPDGGPIMVEDMGRQKVLDALERLAKRAEKRELDEGAS